MFMPGWLNFVKGAVDSVLQNKILLVQKSKAKVVTDSEDIEVQMKVENSEGGDPKTSSTITIEDSGIGLPVQLEEVDKKKSEGG